MLFFAVAPFVVFMSLVRVFLQGSLRSACVFRHKAAAATTRKQLFSSDAPPEKISRFPVPYKKDLPYDIAELMEEVETKVAKVFMFMSLQHVILQKT